MSETLYIDQSLNDLPNRQIEDDVTDERESKTWFLVRSSRVSGQTPSIEITEAPFTIGRKPGNSLQIMEPTVSGYHARILAVDDHFLVEDLGSTNSTFVNGKRVKDVCRLVDGDTIYFGHASYRLSDHLPGNFNPEETSFENVADEVRIQHLFEKAIHYDALNPVYQPIVDLSNRKTVGFEALCRSQILGLDTAQEIFRAATSRGEAELVSHQMRVAAVNIFQQDAATHALYLNTHPTEFESTDFIDNLTELRQLDANLPIMLEIHEHAITSQSSMEKLCSRLKELQIGLVFDDFGCGESRLLELIRYEPDVVKFDRSLIEGLSDSDRTRKIIGTLVELLQHFQVTALAEGVETEAECNACVDVGFDLAQGYYFGHPKPSDHFE